jgi:hypothetical protein
MRNPQSTPVDRYKGIQVIISDPTSIDMSRAQGMRFHVRTYNNLNNDNKLLRNIHLMILALRFSLIIKNADFIMTRTSREKK